MFAASCRRLHASNLSGWFIFLPLAFLLLAILFFTQETLMLFLICLAISIFLNIYLYSRKNTPGSNRFGDLPEDI
ncbi:MAG: DUF805 domain-containing protein [Desulfovibrio sp.]|nr:DUF805 domain-containing protein [Desulfovibrio sp.]